MCNRTLSGHKKHPGPPGFWKRSGHLGLNLLRGLTLLLGLCLHQQICAQLTTTEATALSLGNIHALTGTAHSIGENPANLAGADSWTLTTWHNRPFLLKDLGVSGISTIIPAFPGNLRGSISVFGIPGFREFTTQAGYGMSLSDRISAGVSIQYTNIHTREEWNYLWTLGSSLGMSYIFSPKTTVAVCLVNPVTVGNQNSYGPLYPSEIAVGFKHLIYAGTWWFNEIAFLQAGRMQVKTALACILHERVQLLGGLHTSPATLSFGARYAMDRLLTDIAFAWSSNTGLHPAITITYVPR